MVDYFALIAPTIESLSKSTVEERRQVYDRLIKMLEAQLRSADPPRSEIDILRERIDLEAAIRRVERRIQAGQIAVGAPLNPEALKPVDEQMGFEPPPVAPKPVVQVEADPIEPQIAEEGVQAEDQTELSPETVAVDQNPPDVDVTPVQPASEPPAPLQSFRFPDPKPDAAPPPPRPTDWASLVPQPRPVEKPANYVPRNIARPSPAGAPVAPPPASMSAPMGDYTPRRPPSPGSDAPPGPPRRPVADQTPHGVKQPVPTQVPREPDPGRPLYGQRGAESHQPASRLADLPAAFHSLPGAPVSQRPPLAREPMRQESLPPLDPAVVEAGQALSKPLQQQPPRSPVEPEQSYADPSKFLRSQTKAGRNNKRRETVMDSQGDAARPTVSIGERPRASLLQMRGTGGAKRLAIISTCIVAILGGIAATAYMLRDDPAEFKSASGKYAAGEKPQAEEKIADRLQTQAPAQNVTPAKPSASQPAASQPQANVAQANPSAPTPDANGVLTQKAMLVMEPSDQSAPAPTLNGRVTWKLETLKSVVANVSEIGSRATVDIPEVGLTAAFVFRRNRDPQSANSHMIEVTFTLGDSNTTGKVRDIRVPELRNDEVSRGTPLSGVPVPVTENVFLVGLNALPSEMQKNLDLLRSQNWIAMPLRFANGKRGVLMFEKGKTGERVMEDAMQAWKAN